MAWSTDSRGIAVSELVIKDVICKFLCVTKINQLEVLFRINQQILWLHIPVHHLHLMDVSQCLNYLSRIVHT